MYAGLIVETATTHELFASPSHPYTIGLLHSIPRMGDRGAGRDADPDRGDTARPASARDGLPVRPALRLAAAGVLDREPRRWPRSGPGERVVTDRSGSDAPHRLPQPADARGGRGGSSAARRVRGRAAAGGVATISRTSSSIRVRLVGDEVAIMTGDQGFVSPRPARRAAAATRGGVMADRRRRHRWRLATTLRRPRPPSDLLQVEDVKVWFPIKDGHRHRAARRGRARRRRRQLLDATRGDARARGRIGMRQDDDRADDHPPVQADDRHGSCSTASTSRVSRASKLKGMRRRMQMVFQDPYASLNPRMNVGGDRRRAPGDPRHRDRCGAARARPRTARDGRARTRTSRIATRTSSRGGQRQRIGVARALALSPT